MTERKLQRTFAVTLALLVVFIVAIALVFNSLGTNIERYMAQKFNEEQLRLSKHIKSHILDHFDSAQGLLGVFAQQMAESGVAARLAANDAKGAASAVHRFAKESALPFMQGQKSYFRLAITDKKGKRLLSVVNLKQGPAIIHEGMPEPAYFEPAERLGEDAFLISKPHEVAIAENGVEQKPRLIDASMPIRHAGKTVGRVFLSTNMSFIEDVIADYDKRTESYDHRWIFDRQGNLIYCSLVMSQEYHQGEITALLGKEAGTYDLMAHGGAQRDLIAINPMQLGENDWVIVAESGFQDVMGIMHNLQRMRTVVVFSLLLLVVAGGSLLYRMAMGKLVAEEKARMNEALAAEENKFRMLIEAAPDPIVILDERLAIADVNSGAVATLRKKGPQDLIGAPFASLIDNVAEFNANIARLGGNEGYFTMEHVIPAADGRALYFENNTSLLKRGQRLFYQTYLRNVTDRREYEFKLKQEKENLDRIVSSVGAGIAIFGPGPRLQWNNGRYAELCKRNEGAKADRCALCAGKDLSECAVDRAFKSGRAVKEERTLVLPEGESRHYFATATPMMDVAGGVAQVIEMVIDVTETRNLESQLLQSEKLASIGELAAGIAHELNNPMAGIIGYSEFLLEELKGQDGPLHDVERIHNEAVRCSKIVQNLLKFSRRHKPQRAEVMLNEVLQMTTDIIEYEFKVNNVLLEKDYAGDLRPVLGDQYQLQQVIMNVLNNAFFYLKDQEGKRLIRIITRNSGNNVVATIWNNGPRISETALTRIFDPFFTTKEVGKGTGLGLSVSHGIVNNHQGTITAQNTGDGVLFTITLPAI